MEQTLKFELPAMFQYLMLALSVVAPILFRIYGKRWLGDQTHPAAIFILAWLSSNFLLNSVDFIKVSHGAVAVIFVLVGFGATSLVEKLRQKPKTTTATNSEETK